MATYAVIKNDKVVNMIIWNGVSKWVKPEGSTVIKADDVSIIDKFIGTGFKPEPGSTLEV